MTHEKYSKAIESMNRLLSGMHLRETRCHLDLADWVGQISILGQLNDLANVIIEGNKQSIKKSLTDFRLLQKLTKTLKKELPVIHRTWEDMGGRNLPDVEIFDSETQTYLPITFEDEFDSNICFLKERCSLIKEEEKVLIDDVDISVCDYIDEYNRLLSYFSPIVKRANIKLMELYDDLALLDNEYSQIITEAYYDFLDENEDEIEEQLINLLYNGYVENYDDPLTSRHWASLLREYFIQAEMDAKKKIIKECFSHQRALSICNPKIINYLYQHCIEETDVELFFRYFLEFAIIQSKAKKNIDMDRRKEKEEPVGPLPELVVSTISDDAELNKLFRESLARVAQKIAYSNMSIKWSHLKKVLEDDEIISPCNPTDFGRMVNAILPEYAAENVRKGVSNNPITLKGDEGNAKYSDLPLMNTYRKDFMAVGKEFEKLRQKMMSSY